MQISIRNMKGETFTVDTEPAAKLLDLKQKIFETKGIEVETQKLVYKGKVPNDTDTLEAIGCKDKDYMVIMILKKPTAPVKKTEEIKEEAPKIIPSTNQPIQNVSPIQHPVQPPRPAMSTIPAEHEPTVEELMKMGFDREQVVQALRAAFFNADRAVEYLINGIPQGVMDAGPNTLPSGPRPGPALHPGPPTGLHGGPHAGILPGQQPGPGDQISAQEILNNPQLLQTLMMHIQETNPQLYTLISQNPEMYLNYLLNRQGAPMGEPRPPQNEHVVYLTPEEKGAIDRLMSFGFSKYQAYEAWIACDKNEELAASYLFNQAENDPEFMTNAQQGAGGGQGEPHDQNDPENDDEDDDLYSA